MTRGVRCPLRKAGSRFQNTLGEWATIVADIDYKYVSVVFDSGTKGELQYQHLKSGDFKDWMTPTVFGVGYLGRPRTRGLKDSAIYSRWHAMLQRCYTDDFPAYANVVVSEDWWNYSNFLDWMSCQRQARNHGWEIDKDLLGGMMYSKETCVLVPKEINLLLAKPAARDLPTGVKKLGTNKFEARISYGGKLNRLIGVYMNEHDAGNAYKEMKEMQVKELAEKWKDCLDTRAYEAIKNWKCGGVA